MRPLIYSINLSLDGSCDHRAGIPDVDTHQFAVENIDNVDAMLMGRVIYEMMEAGWRHPVPAGARPEYMESFARTIDAKKKYVVSSTLRSVDWNAELVQGDLTTAVRQLRSEPGKGIMLSGVTLPLELARLGLIDEYLFLVQPRIVGHGPYLMAGLTQYVDLTLVGRREFPSGKVALHYRPSGSSQQL